MKKPILVINCSAAKSAFPTSAFELYQGGIYKMIRLNTSYKEVFEEILILSAKHGLISGSQVIEPYENRMVERSNTHAVSDFVQKHGRNARSLLKRYADDERDIFVLMTNDYLAVFNAMVGSGNNPLLGFRYHYVSKGHRGIGELRGRVSRVLSYVKGDVPIHTPIFQRSGIANEEELGFVAANCHIGTSLAHTNTATKTSLLKALLDASFHRSLFIDNGLITMLGRGLTIDCRWVFDEYRKIIDSLKPQQRRNVSIVIPDDIHSNTNAQKIVVDYRDDILYLAGKGCRVILPVHKSIDIRSHANTMMKTLNYNKNVVLGVPCLAKSELNLMLSTADIDALLSLTAEVRGVKRKVFMSVHYLGMSDASGKEKLSSRLALCRLHGVTVSLDCVRTTALYGRTKNGLRQGTRIEQELRDAHAKPQVLSSNDFKAYGSYEEYYKPNSEPVMTDDLYSMLNEEQVSDFMELYNSQIMKTHPVYQLPSFEKGEEEDAISMAWDLTSIPEISNIIIAWCKKKKWDYFRNGNAEITELSYREYRYESIKRCFTESGNTPVPVQMPLDLGEVA